MRKYSAFSYVGGRSFLHKCPARFKLLFVPLVGACFLFLPVFFCFCLIIIQLAAAFCLKFSLKQQFADLKPVVYYGFFLFAADCIACVFSEEINFATCFTFENQKETIFLLAKIFCAMQSVSLVFKTSTSLELRSGIEEIELAARKFFHLKEKTFFTNAVSMFLNFIPQVSQIWAEAERAWIIRGGKKSVKMCVVLLPVLFSVGMKKACNAAQAMQIRNAR